MDLLRFFAFLLVFIHHAVVFLPSGHTYGLPAPVFEVVRYASGYGLCLFFLLSSFLITEIVLREKETTGSIHIKAFYIRRVLRIWPLYFAFLAVGFAVGRVWPDLGVNLSYVLQYSFLLGNIAFYRHITANPIGPLWSISVEEQFYLCWPFLAERFGRKGLLILSSAIIPISVAASIWLTAHATYPGFAIWTNSLTEFECFAAGALLAIGMHDRDARRNDLARAALLLGGLTAWAVSDGVFHFKRAELLVDRRQLPHVAGFQLIVLGAALILLGMLGMPLPRWSKPFLYLGRISYGLYVFHILALQLVVRAARKMVGAQPSFEGLWANALAFSAAFALTVCLASLSYRFFERRFLVLKERFTYVKTSSATL